MQHLREVQGQKNGALRAVIGPQDFYFFDLDAGIVMLTSSIEQTGALFIHAVMSGDECVRFSCLLIQMIVRSRASEHFTLTAFELAQDLIVPLSSHHNLAMDVLYVHILPAMPRIRSHQTSLISDTGLDVVDSRG